MSAVAAFCSIAFVVGVLLFVFGLLLGKADEAWQVGMTGVGLIVLSALPPAVAMAYKFFVVVLP